MSATARVSRVLVVGATGRMGVKIVGALHARGGVTIRALHRQGSKADSIAALRGYGAECMVGDLGSDVGLAAACAEIDVVVSAVLGPRAVIVDGQRRLLRAAERAGVKRMLPSDYSIDFLATRQGDNRNLDERRAFHAVLDASPVRGTSVLCGAFMDLLAYGAMGPDLKTGVFKVWGSPDQPYDFTATDDVAAYVAAVALDSDSPRVIRVAGDTRSPREITAIAAEVQYRSTSIEAAGTLAELDRTIDHLRAADEAPGQTFPVWQQLQYVRDMASGRGKLAPLDNARYPEVKPQTIRTFLAAAKSR